MYSAFRVPHSVFPLHPLSSLRVRSACIRYVAFIPIMLGAKRRTNVAQPFANLLFVISFLCLVNPTEAELSGSSGLVEDQAIQLRQKAISLGEQHQIDAATEAFSASRQLFEELAKDDPLNSRYSAEIARTLESMGNMFVGNEQFDRALDCYRQSCQVRQQLSAKDPSDVSPIHELATSFAEMGRVDFLEKKYDEATILRQGGCPTTPHLANSITTFPKWAPLCM
jgi:tetratricopeptide (TPR) repeat protein